MTEQERMALARTLGRLDHTIAWLEIQSSTAKGLLPEEDDKVWQGRFLATVQVAGDTLPGLQDIRTELESLLEESYNGKA